jgi:hypothetical protein
VHHKLIGTSETSDKGDIYAKRGENKQKTGRIKQNAYWERSPCVHHYTCVLDDENQEKQPQPKTKALLVVQTTIEIMQQ